MKLFIGSLFILIYSFSYSQENEEANKSKKHELSIVVEDFFAKNSFSYYNDPYYYYNYRAYGFDVTNVGLGYRFHLKKTAIRARVSLGYDSQKYNGNNNITANEHVIFNLYTSLGYEFHSDLGKAQFFYGVDLFISSGNLIDKNYNNKGDQTNEYSEKKSGFGVAPLMGIKYKFTPMISISTELRLSIEKYSTENITQRFDGSQDAIFDNKGLKTEFGPVGFLSLNVHF